jgi:hypothetical protein
MLLEAEWQQLLADYPALADIATHPDARQCSILELRSRSTCSIAASPGPS